MLERKKRNENPSTPMEMVWLLESMSAYTAMIFRQALMLARGNIVYVIIFRAFNWGWQFLGLLRFMENRMMEPDTDDT
jgi:hypothetical protein